MRPLDQSDSAASVPDEGGTAGVGSAAGSDERVYESLVAYGAPLAAWEGHRRLSLEEAVAQGLLLSHQDSTLLRTLPVVLARNATRLDFVQLKMRAEQLGCEAELGMLLELTSQLTGDARLADTARTLEHARHAEPRFYFEPRGPFERKYTPQRTPALMRRWGFFLDMSADVFGALLAKHGAQVQR